MEKTMTAIEVKRSSRYKISALVKKIYIYMKSFCWFTLFQIQAPGRMGTWYCMITIAKLSQ